MCFVRQIELCLTIDDLSRHLQRLFNANRDRDAELGKHAAHHVDQLCALLDQQAARTMGRQRRLLLARLDGHEPHRLAGHRFADSLGISRIVLAALYLGLHVRR